MMDLTEIELQKTLLELKIIEAKERLRTGSMSTTKVPTKYSNDSLRVFVDERTGVTWRIRKFVINDGTYVIEVEPTVHGPIEDKLYIHLRDDKTLSCQRDVKKRQVIRAENLKDLMKCVSEMLLDNGKKIRSEKR